MINFGWKFTQVCQKSSKRLAKVYKKFHSNLEIVIITLAYTWPKFNTNSTTKFGKVSWPRPKFSPNFVIFMRNWSTTLRIKCFNSKTIQTWIYFWKIDLLNPVKYNFIELNIYLRVNIFLNIFKGWILYRNQESFYFSVRSKTLEN